MLSDIPKNLEKVGKGSSEKTLFQISDTVSDETSIPYAFLSGILPDGDYKFQLKFKRDREIVEIDLEVRDGKYNIRDRRKIA